MDHLLRRTLSLVLALCLSTTAFAAAQAPGSGDSSVPVSPPSTVGGGAPSAHVSPPPPVGGADLAPGHGADAEHSAGTFELPLHSTSVARAFNGPAQPWLPGHRGVDLAAASGQSVYAPAPGTVAFAGVVAGKPVVSLDHAGGIRTTYEPVRAMVRQGDAVAAGQPIGQITTAHPGCPRAWCLHWGARHSAVPDSYFDPLTLLGAQAVPIVLKPV